MENIDLHSLHNQPQYNRRRFLKGLSLTIGSTAISFPLFASPGVTGQDDAKPSPGQETAPHLAKKMGVALVGLGKYSADQLAPALQQTKNCYLAGIVTGTPEKADAWKRKYNISDKNIYNYQNFDSIADNQDIDIIYVVLPNAMHAEYTIRAAKAKKHVICEKPMATSVEDAQRMIAACRDSGVGLSIGYRLHYEPFHKRVMELGQQKVFGNVKKTETTNSGDQTKGSPDIWRLNKELSGGGPLMDMGVYCVQAACYTVGKNPVAVTAQLGEITKPGYFYDVEESITWQMDFGDGVVAECNSSYAESKDSLYTTAENGWWRVSPSYGYEGKKGETDKGKMDLPNIYEQVFQMDAQAESFSKGKQSITPGEMGLRDVKILMAIYESAKNGGKRVAIKY